MALTITSISAAIGASDITIPITSTSSGFPPVGTITTPLQLMQIDDERMLIVTVPVANTVRVAQRGYDGTTPSAHDILSPVSTSSVASDFPVVAFGWQANTYGDDIVSIGQNGTIAVPTKNTTLQITKGSALATTTLGAPTVANDGVRLTITSETAFAHVITATSLVADAVTGSPHTTMTFGAFKGASIVLQAANGLWNVISATVCVVT